MWLRLTFVKVEPSQLKEMRDPYSGEECTGVLRKQKGYRFNSLLESVDNPGEVISEKGGLGK